jgi:hypothetical protein
VDLGFVAADDYGVRVRHFIMKERRGRLRRETGAARRAEEQEGVAVAYLEPFRRTFSPATPSSTTSKWPTTTLSPVPGGAQQDVPHHHADHRELYDTAREEEQHRDEP